MDLFHLPSGKHTNNYGKSPCLMGKSTINDHHNLKSGSIELLKSRPKSGQTTSKIADVKC
jgi:hypothetical protein